MWVSLYLCVCVSIFLCICVSASLQVCESVFCVAVSDVLKTSEGLCTCMSTGLRVCEFACLDMCVYMPPCLCVSRRACVSCYSSFRVTVCPSVFCLHSRLTPPESLRASAAAGSRCCGLFVCLSASLRFCVSWVLCLLLHVCVFAPAYLRVCPFLSVSMSVHTCRYVCRFMCMCLGGFGVFVWLFVHLFPQTRLRASEAAASRCWSRTCIHSDAEVALVSTEPYDAEVALASTAPYQYPVLTIITQHTDAGSGQCCWQDWRLQSVWHGQPRTACLGTRCCTGVFIGEPLRQRGEDCSWVSWGLHGTYTKVYIHRQIASFAITCSPCVLFVWAAQVGNFNFFWNSQLLRKSHSGRLVNIWQLHRLKKPF